MKHLITITFILICTFSISAQDEDLKQCTQFLNKSMAETSACEKVNLAQKELIAEKQKRIDLLTQQLEIERKYNEIIFKRQEETIKRLEVIKCSKTTFFLFIVKIKKCF